MAGPAAPPKRPENTRSRAGRLPNAECFRGSRPEAQATPRARRLPSRFLGNGPKKRPGYPHDESSGSDWFSEGETGKLSSARTQNCGKRGLRGWSANAWAGARLHAPRCGCERRRLTRRGVAAFSFCRWNRAGALLAASQRGGVPASSPAVTRGFGTQPPVFAPSISARRSASVCIASGKRAQSARNSSETKSPGRLGVRARGGVSGCSFGPRITPHRGVETVDKSELVWTARRLQRSGPSGGDVRRELYAVARGLRPPEGVGCQQNRRKEREALQGDRSEH